MADFKYSLNGVDLFDVKGFAYEEKPKWYLDSGTSQAIPSRNKGGVSLYGQNGSTPNRMALRESVLVPLHIVITSYGDEDTDYADDEIRNFRENKEFIKSLLYKNGETPLLRYFSWLATNVKIPEDLGNPNLGYFFYHDSDCRIVSVQWEEVYGTYTASLKVVLEVPAAEFRSKYLRNNVLKTDGDFKEKVEIRNGLSTFLENNDSILHCEISELDATTNCSVELQNLDSEDEVTKQSTVNLDFSKGRKSLTFLKEGITFYNDTGFDMELLTKTNVSSDTSYDRLLKSSIDDSDIEHGTVSYGDREFSPNKEDKIAVKFNSFNTNGETPNAVLYYRDRLI